LDDTAETVEAPAWFRETVGGSLGTRAPLVEAPQETVEAPAWVRELMAPPPLRYTTLLSGFKMGRSHAMVQTFYVFEELGAKFINSLGYAVDMLLVSVLYKFRDHRGVRVDFDLFNASREANQEVRQLGDPDSAETFQLLCAHLEADFGAPPAGCLSARVSAEEKRLFAANRLLASDSLRDTVGLDDFSLSAPPRGG
jgi:hypothetical protein